MTDSPARIDVVIPTFNRPAALVRCLEALAAQPDRQGLQVIVIDDGSEFPAADAIPAVLSNLVGIRVIRQKNAGPASARNTGISVSNAEFIAFVDDDVCVDPGWLSAYRRAIAADGPGAFAYFGPLAAPRNWRPTPWNRWEASTLQIEYERMNAGVYDPTWRQFFTGNALVRNAIIEEVGGFDERFTRAEDIELGLRMKLKSNVTFRFVEAAVGWHYAYRTLESWLRIPRAYGHYEVLIDSLHPESGHAERLVRELTQQRSFISRSLRRPARHDSLRALGVWGTTRAAIGLSAVGLNPFASKLLSLAYDAEYSNAFFANLGEAVLVQGGEQAINSPSTAGGYAQTR